MWCSTTTTVIPVARCRSRIRPPERQRLLRAQAHRPVRRAAATGARRRPRGRSPPVSALRGAAPPPGGRPGRAGRTCRAPRRRGRAGGVPRPARTPPARTPAGPNRWAPVMTFSRTDSRGNTAGCWKVRAMPHAATRWGGRRRTSRPATRTVPSSGSRRPGHAVEQGALARRRWGRSGRPVRPDRRPGRRPRAR